MSVFLVLHYGYCMSLGGELPNPESFFQWKSANLVWSPTWWMENQLERRIEDIKVDKFKKKKKKQFSLHHCLHQKKSQWEKSGKISVSLPDVYHIIAGAEAFLLFLLFYYLPFLHIWHSPKLLLFSIETLSLYTKLATVPFYPYPAQNIHFCPNLQRKTFHMFKI